MKAIKRIVVLCAIAVAISIHISIVGAETMPFESVREDEFTKTRIVNVLNYESIQDAVDAAPVGSTVYFPRGDYTVTEPITITKNINLVGEGFGSKLYQNADEHLLYIGGDNYVRYIRVEDLYLSSAATTPGKSALRLEKVTDSYFKNITLKGGYYGIHLYGALRNTFTAIETDTGAPTFGSPSVMEYCIYAESRDSLGSNSNSFFSCGIRGNTSTAKRGYHFYCTTGGGRFNIIGGTVEGFSIHGIYAYGIGSSFTIQGIHCEAWGAYIEIVNCATGEITSVYHSPEISYPLTINRSTNIDINNGFIKGILIDRSSRNIVVENIHLGAGGIVNYGANTSIKNITHTGGFYSFSSGMQNTSARNLVDGDLEVWSGNIPIGFADDNGAILSEDTNTYRFGKKSCKVTIGPDKTRGGIYHIISGDRFKELARPDPANYRNSHYQWTASGNGTNEYYLEASGGGDADVSKPLAVLANNTPIQEGTVGALANLEWGHADNDSLGYSTLYIRDDSGSPDLKPSGYIEAVYRLRYLAVSAWVYVPENNGGTPNLYIYKTGGVGSSYVQSSFSNVLTEEWTRIHNVIPLDPTRTSCQVEFGMYDATAGDTVYFDGIEIVPGMGATSLFDDSKGLDGDLRVGGRFITSPIQIFSDSDSTPSVANGSVFKTENTGAITITMFDDGYPGQQITVIISDSNTTIDFTDTNLKGNGGTDWQPASGDHMTCVFDGTDWYCNISDNT